MTSQRITQPGSTIPMAPFLNAHKPWVSVVCTCYNQGPYVRQSLESVVNQTYPNVELIVIDNASTDNSAAEIEAFCVAYPQTRVLCPATNLGLCRAFNQGLALAIGEYIIDLAADDVLLPDRIARQVERFLSLPDYYGVVFTNAAYINANGDFLRHHYAIRPNGRTWETVPSGDVFREVLAHYFINTPTMMMRRQMLVDLGGYDETLAYEDFDLWVRSARSYRYAYLDEVLTHKRLLPNSLGQQITRPHNGLLESSWRVCQKAYLLCQTTDEFAALADRIRRFIRKCFYTEQYYLARQFGQLLAQMHALDSLSRTVLFLCRLHLPINGVYRRYRLANR